MIYNVLDLSNLRVGQANVKTPADIQVVSSPEGKIILSAWMNLWNRTRVTDCLGHGWQGMLTLPRELAVKDGRLLQKTVSALAKCLKNSVSVNDTLTGEKSYAGIEGRTLCLRVKADISSCRRFGVKVLSDGAHFLSAVYDREKQQFILDRRKSLHRIKGHEREQGAKKYGFCRTIAVAGFLKWKSGWINARRKSFWATERGY